MKRGDDGSFAGGDEAAHAELAALLSGATQAICFLDRELRCTRANPALAQLTGRALADHAGAQLTELLPLDDAAPLRRVLRQVLETGQPRSDVELALPDRTLSGSFFPVRLAGETIGVGGILCDPVERSRAAELRQALRYRDFVVGILGHDLRAPLAVVLAGADVALKRVSDETSRSMLEKVRASGQRMGRMIEQLLDLTRARTNGGIPVTRGPIDLADVARAVVAEVELAFPSRQVLLAATGDTAGSWDRDRMWQAFSNLLGNALLHGEPAHPVELRLDGSDAQTVRVAVKNHGAIPAGLLPRVFDPFRRGHRDDESAPGGLGLGLYITREIILAHGGQIEVRSTPDAGTVFAIELPRVT